MDDTQIQEQVLVGNSTPQLRSSRIRSARPASLVIAFLTAIGLTSILSIGPWYTTSLFWDHLIRRLLMESQFDAFVAVVFWLSLRPSATSSIARVVPITCVVSALVLKWWGYENLLMLWLLGFRLALVWLIFELIRRGFRFALRSASEPPFAAHGLNLATILCITAIFAVLLMADIQVRKTSIGQGQDAADFPSVLAIGSACSRSFLWFGLGLVCAQGDRRYVIAGIASLFFWVITRVWIVVYIRWFLNSEFSSQRLTEMEQLWLIFATEAFQFAFVLMTCALFFLAGYRFRIGSKRLIPESSANCEFDSIQ